MINLKNNRNEVQWSIIAGIFLLIFAFVIILTSQNNNASNITKTSASSEVGNTTILDIETPIEEASSTAENVTEEATTSQPKAKDLINFDTDYPFIIRVNRAENFAVVYGMDEDGHHTIPYKAFTCSTGLNEEYTPLGVFEMSDKYRWRLMVDGTYAQYAIRIEGQIMLHSVPYVEPSPDTLEYWEYNKLGKAASLGCVRFRVSAIKWIYNNCKKGTKVNIYSKPGEKPPIKINKIKKIRKSNPNSGWDPTDPDKSNPWNTKNKTSNKKKKKDRVKSNNKDTIVKE